MITSVVQITLLLSLGYTQAGSTIPTVPIMRKKPIAKDFHDTHPFPRLPHGVSDRPVVIDVPPSLPRWQKFAAVCFQGLANRERGDIYLLWDDTDTNWIELWREVGYEFKPQHKRIADIPEIIRDRFCDCVNGILLYEESMINADIWSMLVNVYTAIAAEERLIPVPASYRGAYEFLPVAFDARGRWKSEADAYQWVVGNYPYLTRKGPLAHQHPSCLRERDYYVAHRILPIFYWEGMPERTKRLFEHVLEATGANQFVIGLWDIPTWNIPEFEERGHPPGLGNEHDLVRLISPYGKIYQCTGEQGVANLSYQSGMSLRLRHLKRSEQTVPLETTKTYVVLNISDGDNIWNVWRKDGFAAGTTWWNNDIRGKFPINWTLSPAIADLMPGVASYLYATATPNDCFSASVSGYGYVLLDDFGDYYANRDEIHRAFQQGTGEYMKRMDMRTSHLFYNYDYASDGPIREGHGLREMEIAIEELSKYVPLKCILLDYCIAPGINAENATVLVKGVPLFHALNKFSEDINETIQYIHANTPDEKPAFLHVFCVNWHYPTHKLAELVNGLGDEYVIVDAETLGELYARWQSLG